LRLIHSAWLFLTS
ncbi:protein ApaG, partial [Vibrio harveyi]